MNYNKTNKIKKIISLLQNGVMLVAILFSYNYIQADDDFNAKTNLGTMLLGEVQLHNLTIENQTLETLEIGFLKSSCECLKIIEYPSKIDAGKSAVVKIKIDAVKPGAFAYLIEMFGWNSKKSIFDFVCDVDVIENSDTISSKNIEYINANSLIKSLQQNEKFILIDVRLSKKFAAAHIRDSINMPLETIKARTFLKSKNIVIIDDGWGNSLTEMEIVKLNTMGFKSVNLLFGGLKTWRDNGGGVAGVGGDISINEVEPKALFRGLNSKKWTIIDVTLSTNFCAKMFPKSIRFSKNKNNPDALANKISMALAKMTNLNYIAIIDDDGKKARNLITKIVPQENYVAFSVKGGMDALKERKKFNVSIAKRSAPGYISPRIKMKRTPCGGCL